MFTETTYQDYEKAADKLALILRAVQQYKNSRDFLDALDANAYFSGNNAEIAKKVMLKLESQTVTDADNVTRKALKDVYVKGNRIGSNFLFRLVAQQNQHLLSNGVTLKDSEVKKRLGMGFDTVLSRMGERALLHGVTWGFWNLDHLEAIPAAVDAESGCVALLDEVAGEPRVVIQFWQIDKGRPQRLRVFLPDGIYKYVERDGVLEPDGDPTAYKTTTRHVLGSTEVANREGYKALPVVPLFANEERRSEFTAALKSKIDAYDRICSDFADNLDRANDVYWVFNNFGGEMDEIVKMMAEIQRVRAVANISDGNGQGSTAAPHTIEVPYAARKAAMDLLEEAMYKDYMAMNLTEVTGGSLTNVAIKAAMMNLDLKCDRFEWQCFEFVQRLLSFLGVDGLTSEDIAFKRQALANDTETVQNIYMARADLDTETVLKKLPFVLQEEIPGILANLDAERVTGLPSLEELQAAMDKTGEPPP